MKRLVYPFVLVFVSLAAAAIITTVTATTLASYYKNDKNSNLAKENVVLEQATASR